MKPEENAAILLLSEALNKWGDHARQVEAAMMDLHKRYDKLRKKVEKKDAGDLSNVNA